MTYVWVLTGVAALVVLFVTWVTIYNRIGGKTTVSEVGTTLRFAIEGGMDGLQLKLKDTASRRFVEFHKKIPVGGPTSFRMILSERCCSQLEFEAARRSLHAEGIDFEVVGAEGATEPALTVNVGRDVEKAKAAANAVLIGAFGLQPTSCIRAGLRGGLDVRRGASWGWGDSMPGPT